METNYFKSRKNESFGSNLANLLLVLGDKNNAQKVYDGFMRHKLVKPDGAVYVPYATRLVSDLTDCAYEGRLYIHLNPGFEDYTKRLYPRDSPMILKILNEEKNKGMIQSFGMDPECSYPLLLLVHSQDSGIWAVGLNENRIIRDGMVGGIRVQRLRLAGLLEVKHSNPPVHSP